MNSTSRQSSFATLAALCVAMSASAALVPVSPVGGDIVALVPDAQKKVMDLPTLEERIALFREDREHGGKVIRHDPFWRKARPFTLVWRATEGETGPWKVEIGKNPTFEGADIRYVKSDSIKSEDGVFTYTMPRSNLEIARTYYWRVTGLGKPAEGQKKGPAVHSGTASFATEDRAPRWIEIEGKVANIRDFGGRHTLDGRRVRQGLVFRGEGLNHNSVTGERQGRNRLTVEDVKYFTRTLGIKTDLDLRSKEETADLDESPLGPSVKFVLRSSPAYKGIFSESGKKTMAENVRVFCDPANYPIYFHCIGGADRTGSLAYTLLAVLGVAPHEIETDWESTFYPNIPDDIHENEPDFWRRESHFTDGFAQYGDKGDTLQRRAERYLLDCGITEEEIARIREILLIDIPAIEPL
ncbi:MAG: tyrosine-protein phosphatase [Kiritimatiellae bacterium]|nr:tyrosine-protein phosphatase [Kiritimatiellia bacterium]